MKISDMIVSALVKRGILYEARNVDVEFKIPTEMVHTEHGGEALKNVTVHLKAEHMTLKIDKEDKEEA